MLSDVDADRLKMLARYVNSPHEGRLLLELERKVDEADICDPDQIPPDVVTMNSRVRVRFEDTGEDVVYTLVFPSAVNARFNRVSVLGTLGRALLGSRVGDVVSYDTGLGTRRCRLEQLIYQPESAGDYSA
jgi:regulator of nucleoside diphosphate kinase